MFNFYPRPPRGGRPADQIAVPPDILISIHALREEGDNPFFYLLLVIWNFYPRPPRGGRRALRHEILRVYRFLSTPSARRATQDIMLGLSTMLIFLSTPSARRATGDHFADIQQIVLFLSTPSARRATLDRFGVVQGQVISIHALREEGDLTRHKDKATCTISIHALREEGDLTAVASHGPLDISIHALREEGDPLVVHGGASSA